MGIDYEAESKRLAEHESMTWWKPNPGRHEVKILSEPEDKIFESDSGEKTEQVECGILVNNEKMQWTIGKGKSSASLYGQLVELGKMNGGKLEGVTFELVVTKTGLMSSGSIKRSYKIPVVEKAQEETVK